jgi:murein DD-endopeptidase MepM/ murein hydrolase activator NlpD
MKRLFRLSLVLALALGLAVLLLVSLRVGPAPEVRISPSARAIGMRGTVVVTATAAGRGLARLRVEVEQKGKTTVVAREDHKPLPAWSFGGRHDTRTELQADVGRKAVPGLVGGEATVRVVAERAGTWLRQPDPVVVELKLPVRLTPPSLSLVSTQHYVTQGGSGVVVYRVGEGATRDGVRVGSWFFSGRPLPGSSGGERVALFGVPWDMGDDKAIRLLAEDEAGNSSEVAFVDQYFPKPPGSDTIKLEDAFINRVVPEIMAQTPGLEDKGTPLDNYLQVNRDLRKKNAAELVELSRQSEARFLWKEPFLPLHNAAVKSSFADQRSYVYNDKPVDQQTHLGYDLAVTERSPVTAANKGVVKLARYFGIYGNTVVLDHGFGLMTLYSHLSSIDVKDGQEVERGAVIGRTGKTGLAGGDHLHFTTLVGGLPVRPTEWWDPHWIHDRVAVRLAPAVVFEGELAVK